MKIEVLGTGCAKCRKMYDLVSEVAAESNPAAEVVKVEQIQKIMDYGIMMTPALVIDGEIKVSGAVPKPAQIAEWIAEAARKPLESE